MKKQIKRLANLSDFDVLNQHAMHVISGGYVAEETTNSDKKDVDSNSQDSYRDDKSNLELSPDF